MALSILNLSPWWQSLFHEFYCLLVGEIFLKILSSLPFSISYTQLPLQLFFSHLICPRVIPTQKCENDLVWTATYTAGKFHHGWMGDFCTWFLLESSINNVTNKCPCSIFSYMHPEVVSLTKSHRKTQSQCVLLEFGFFPKFASSFVVGVW